MFAVASTGVIEINKFMGAASGGRNLLRNNPELLPDDFCVEPGLELPSTMLLGHLLWASFPFLLLESQQERRECQLCSAVRCVGPQPCAGC